MVETSWTRRSARAAVASLVLAPLLIAATAAGPTGRPWVPPACPDPPSLEVGGMAPEDGARYQLEPVLVDGELRGQRVTLAHGAFRSRSLELAAESFAAGPFGDAVLIGTDDGTRSTLSLIDVRRGCAWLLATAPDVIRSATIDPTGRQVHEARVDRVTRADLGIWRRPVEAADAATPALEPIETPRSARPATSMPVTAPARNATVRPACKPVCAAAAVRTLERTEMFIPIKPATPDRTAPTTKPVAEMGPRKYRTITATTTPTMAMVVYWRFR